MGGKKQERGKPNIRTLGFKAQSKWLKWGGGRRGDRSRGEIWKLQAGLDVELKLIGVEFKLKLELKLTFGSPHALCLPLPFFVLHPFPGGLPSSGGNGSFRVRPAGGGGPVGKGVSISKSGMSPGSDACGLS